MRFSHTFASSGETRYHSDRRLLENTGRARPKNVLSPRTVHVSRGHRREMRAILPTRRFRAPYYPTISVSLTNVYSGLFGKPKRANFDFFFFWFLLRFFWFLLRFASTIVSFNNTRARYGAMALRKRVRLLRTRPYRQQ